MHAGLLRLGNTDSIVELDDPRARDPELTGAKAAALSRAGVAGLPIVPGFVLTTQWSPANLYDLRATWEALSDGAQAPVVVRSSSTVEDGSTSSMAGLFTSVIDVRTWDATREAVDEVLASRSRTDLVDAPMAVLIQRHVDAVWGGVLFGADPVTGRTDRLVVSAVAGGPDALVSGAASGWTAALTKGGRVVGLRSAAGSRPPRRVLRSLAKLAARAAKVFGGPQDIEWAVDRHGRTLLLQSRPITTLHGEVRGPVLGPGPLAETFPEPLSPLEQDLWVPPVGDGLRHALALTGSASARALRRSPVVTVVADRAVADLELLGASTRKKRWWHRLNPAPPYRRLRASWRVGRLRAAFPSLARDLVEQVDAELAAVPSLDQLSNHDLLAVLENGRRALVAVHGHEALAGLLVPTGATAVTAASTALSVLTETGPEAVDADDLIAHHPVVLALVPPRIGAGHTLPAVGNVEVMRPPAEASDPSALAREALRLRARWIHELTARAAWELGQRLAALKVLPEPGSVRLLGLDELRRAALERIAPPSLAERSAKPPRALPAEFRLAADGAAIAVARPRTSGATGAGGGRGRGRVHLGTNPPVGSVLVVDHLDPRLAGVIPSLAGLVAETGSPLSHLAILAREYGVPTVVGVAGARSRFDEGDLVDVDGDAGTVAIVSDLTTGVSA